MPLAKPAANWSHVAGKRHRQRVFPVGQSRYSLMDVVIDRAELRGRVPLPEVGAPAPQRRVEHFDNHELKWQPDLARCGQVADLASDRGHGPW